MRLLLGNLGIRMAWVGVGVWIWFGFGWGFGVDVALDCVGACGGLVFGFIQGLGLDGGRVKLAFGLGCGFCFILGDVVDLRLVLAMLLVGGWFWFGFGFGVGVRP